MPMLGQASGGFLESSSALRILHVGVRNTVGILTDDAFTQVNPPIVTAAATVSDNVDTTVRGVLSGSVAFTRPDVGANYHGGNVEGLANANFETLVRPLGLYINNAAGNAYENLPGPASGKGPYVSAQGTHASALFETQVLDGTGITATAGDDLTYVTGMELIASRNGYLTTNFDVVNAESLDIEEIGAESEHAGADNSGTVIGILKMPADSVQPELVFDQRI